MDNKRFNITRRQGRNVTIFRRNLPEADAKREVRHWKRLARNAGGHVYFEVVQVPEELVVNEERNELLAEVA